MSREFGSARREGGGSETITPMSKKGGIMYHEPFLGCQEKVNWRC